MRLWKLVDQSQWRRFNDKGCLVADGRRVERVHKHAFDWLARELPKRLQENDTAVKYPQWAWKTRPDLRSLCHYLPACTHRLLEIEVPDEDVVLLDLNDWIYILNGFYLADSESRGDAFDAMVGERGEAFGWPYSDAINEHIMSSWQKIFEPNLEVDPEWVGSRPGEDMEAVFWKLGAKQALSVQEVEGCCRRSA
jgi:Domain of unknown function (DUF3841)